MATVTVVFFFDVSGTSLGLVIRRTLVGEMVLQSTDHAKAVLAAAFLFFWEEFAIFAKDLREIGFLGFRGGSGS